MQQIGEHLPRERAVRFEELRVQVEEDDVRILVSEMLPRLRRDLGALPAHRIVRCRVPREDVQDDDLRLGMDLADRPHDRLDAAGCSQGAVVVRADHHGEELRLVAVELAVLHAPEAVLGRIAAVAEVEDGIAVRQERPRLLAAAAVALPPVRDGVADHDDVEPAVRHALLVDLDDGIVRDLLHRLERTVRELAPPSHAERRHGYRRHRVRARHLGLDARREGRGEEQLLAILRRQRVIEIRKNGVRPDLIAVRGGMQAIRHDFAEQLAVSRQERGREVKPEDVSSVTSFHSNQIHLQD